MSKQCALFVLGQQMIGTNKQLNAKSWWRLLVLITKRSIWQNDVRISFVRFNHMSKKTKRYFSGNYYSQLRLIILCEIRLREKKNEKSRRSELKKKVKNISSRLVYICFKKSYRTFSLSLSLSIYLSIYLSIHLFTFLFFSPYIYIYIYIYIYMKVCLYIYIYIYI